MKKNALILTLTVVILLNVGCTQTPEAPVQSIDKNTSIATKSVDNNTSDMNNSTDTIVVVTDENNQSNTNGTDAITVVTDESNQSNTNDTDAITVVTDESNQSNTNGINILISKIKNKKLTPSEERKVYTSFNSVGNTYPITIDGVKIESYDRSIKYDHIDGHNLTACTRTKDVIMTSNNKSKKFRVCQTTNYDWIVK